MIKKRTGTGQVSAASVITLFSCCEIILVALTATVSEQFTPVFLLLNKQRTQEPTRKQYRILLRVFVNESTLIKAYFGTDAKHGPLTTGNRHEFRPSVVKTPLYK